MTDGCELLVPAVMVRIGGSPSGRKCFPHDTQSESRPVPHTYDRNEDWGVRRDSLPTWNVTLGSGGRAREAVLSSRFLLRSAVFGAILRVVEPLAMPSAMFSLMSGALSMIQRKGLS